MALHRFAIALPLALLLGAPLHAQSLIVGLGYSDFQDEESSDQASLSVEYQHSPFFERGRFDAKFAAAVSVHANGDVHLGVGVAAEYQLNGPWFLEASVLPGAFFEAESINDLGSTFEIRSLLGVGYRLDSGDAVSLAITHKSNASTASRNPGVNTILLRYHKTW